MDTKLNNGVIISENCHKFIGKLLSVCTKLDWSYIRGTYTARLCKNSILEEGIEIKLLMEDNVCTLRLIFSKDLTGPSITSYMDTRVLSIYNNVSLYFKQKGDDYKWKTAFNMLNTIIP